MAQEGVQMKPRVRRDSSGWWFATLYCPDMTLPGETIWTGPYRTCEEALFGKGCLRLATWNLNVADAPTTGEPFIAMARLPDATSGFPQMVMWLDGAFRVPGPRIGDPLIIWAWMPRDVLGPWPAERAMGAA